MNRGKELGQKKKRLGTNHGGEGGGLKVMAGSIYTGGGTLLTGSKERPTGCGKHTTGNGTIAAPSMAHPGRGDRVKLRGGLEERTKKRSRGGEKRTFPAQRTERGPKAEVKSHKREGTFITEEGEGDFPPSPGPLGGAKVEEGSCSLAKRGDQRVKTKATRRDKPRGGGATYRLNKKVGRGGSRCATYHS